MEEAWERGWVSTDKYVCKDCVNDEALVRLVVDSVEDMECTYCGRLADEPIAAPLDVLTEAIVDGLSTEYEDPIEQVSYVSREGGYQMPHQDTYDLLQELEVVNDFDLIVDLANAIETQLWCQRDPYRPSPHDALRWGWSGFREHVMHKRRYTFLLADPAAQEQRDYGEIPPEDMLHALARAIRAGDLVTVLPAGTELVRARVHPPAQQPSTAAEIGSPPGRVAKTNRMTAAGISGFYGAFSEQCALAEVAGYAGNDDHVTLGTFVTARDMLVVDLVNLPAAPSLFDESRRHLRPAIRFLRDFAADVANVAQPDDKEHLDYVPTQVVAEYLRMQFAHPGGPIRGVMWGSSRMPDEQAIVLFVDHDECVDEYDGWKESGAHWVALRAGSLRRVESLLLR
ncbi:hypothetical protein PA7_45760 [Pseudonocardia asaccharolytica DSM 44247 = NBRC 16224]|uniref:RES domain-containing protein n=1 Tax=Pseudonocardia asaccharolytica DSM 44247 = NBRC 16224 TaxID=1123024 RepID=A0A511D7F5_9PSEU|nr:hypothetical protein PA7_45760 [Pseudonocardia asaccharolytica DSM 44247 = NBRC 16224]